MFINRKSSVRLIFLVIFLIFYTVGGGYLLSLIEYPYEQSLRTRTIEDVNKFLGNNSCLTEEELHSFITMIIDAQAHGYINAAKINTSDEPNWSLGQAFFFAGTVLTTIGYGHITPVSELGKMFCVVYALIGIPLTLIMLSALAERLSLLCKKLLKCYHRLWKDTLTSFIIRLLYMITVSFFLIIIIFIIPALCFMYIEDTWTFLDAFYYCFISMTTIGLGDYIPGENRNTDFFKSLYYVGTTLYLFVGLVFMMTFLSLIYDVPELNFGYYFYLRSDDDETERIHLRSTDEIPKYGIGGIESNKSSRSAITDLTESPPSPYNKRIIE